MQLCITVLRTFKMNNKWRWCILHTINCRFLQGLEKWRTEKGDPNALPSSYQERKAFKEMLLAMRMPDDKGGLDEENFKEAVDALVRTVHRTGVCFILIQRAF